MPERYSEFDAAEYIETDRTSVSTWSYTQN